MNELELVPLEEKIFLRHRAGK